MPAGDGSRSEPRGGRAASHAAYLHDLEWGDKYDHAMRESLGIPIDDYYLGYQHDNRRLTAPAGGAEGAAGAAGP